MRLEGAALSAQAAPHASTGETGQQRVRGLLGAMDQTPFILSEILVQYKLLSVTQLVFG